MAKCRITVLKTTFNKDLVDLYVSEERKKTIGPCEVFKEGQEFEADAVSGMPQGFCAWAWDDIYKVVVGYFADGDFGMWYRNGKEIIACCTDGTRPVIFKIEKL
ncbi:MAG: TIGR04076 family protein [Spirochaetaceae bacterium]|nr:TIGR04076 family protein [Spirochaetaceae bacterium]